MSNTYVRVLTIFLFFVGLAVLGTVLTFPWIALVAVFLFVFVPLTYVFATNIVEDLNETDADD